ncbi:bifunctional endoribonuclease/protein kinase ire1 [Dispira parvispora]|uniref:non-specific serine/threonine protein kinase n=1 Tax=Dispira parvispora TaxID=1520584 RepID=A0A9W8AT10_9FUNG|nr:bifunctional endoribonuclease/protein kinase ire1 [Dispira parvispora]
MWPLWVLAVFSVALTSHWAWNLLLWTGKCCYAQGEGGALSRWPAGPLSYASPWLGVAAETSPPYSPASPVSESQAQVASAGISNQLQYYTRIPPTAYFSEVVLLTTVDGHVSALNTTTGDVLWTQDTLGGPIVKNLPRTTTIRNQPVEDRTASRDDKGASQHDASTTTHGFDNTADDRGWVASAEATSAGDEPPLDEIHLVAPFGEGKIYQLHSNHMLIDSSLSIKELVEKSPSRSKGLMYLGSKRTKYFALELETGRVLRTFAMDDEQGKDGDPLGFFAAGQDGPAVGQDPRNAIYLARTEYRLRVFDFVSNRIKWNVVYSEFVPDSTFHLPADPRTQTEQRLQLFTTPTGTILARDTRTQQLVWSHRFDVPVNAVFDLWAFDTTSPWVVLRNPTHITSDSEETDRDAPRSNDDVDDDVSSGGMVAHVGLTEGGLYVYPETSNAATHLSKQIKVKKPSRVLEAPPRPHTTSHMSTTPESAMYSGKCEGPTFICPDEPDSHTHYNPPPDTKDTDGIVCSRGHLHHPVCLVGSYGVVGSKPSLSSRPVSSTQGPLSLPMLDHDIPSTVNVPLFQPSFSIPQYVSPDLLPWAPRGLPVLSTPPPQIGGAAGVPSLLWALGRFCYVLLGYYWIRLWRSVLFTIALFLVSGWWLAQHHQWTWPEMRDTVLPQLFHNPRNFVYRQILKPIFQSLVPPHQWSTFIPTEALPTIVLPNDGDPSTTNNSHLASLSDPPSDSLNGQDLSTTILPLPDPNEYTRRLGQLLISNHVLGRGSLGTCVYLAKFGADNVAVKQLLRANYDVARREVSILEASRGHPNVMQYRYCTQDEQFIYIALDLCQASLFDLIRAPPRSLLGQTLAMMCPRQALRGIIEGLHFLHGCNIVHRDIKPQNVLVHSPILHQLMHNAEQNRSVGTDDSTESSEGGEPGEVELTAYLADLPHVRSSTNPLQLRLLLSDFGLCKRLDKGQNTFFNTTVRGAGTLGWRAPECIHDPSRLNQLALQDSSGPLDTTSRDRSYSSSSPGSKPNSGINLVSDSVGDATTAGSAKITPSTPDSPPSVVSGEPGKSAFPANGQNPSSLKLTKAVDVFSTGCVFYFFLTRGQHPFGDELIRDYRISQGLADFSALDPLTMDSAVEAKDLIEQMVSHDPLNRPTTGEVLQHPYFWSYEKRLEFLYKVSDCLRIKAKSPQSELAQDLEADREAVIGQDWFQPLDTPIQLSIKERRGFDTTRIQTLLTAIRNKGVHYSEASPRVKRIYRSYPDGYYDYFSTKFPRFFLHVYRFASRHADLYKDEVLCQYFH